ncbi:MAG: hypothetical protein IJ874_02040 [Ruminococcus sp.]|nr:hypothetical protein [Ruminococcus sp.]
MKTLFQVWSILKIVIYGIAALIVILGIAGVSSLSVGSDGYTSAIGGMYVLMLLLSLVSPAMVIIMAAAGLRGSYDTCSKLAIVVIVLDALDLFASDNRELAFLKLVLAVLYFVLIKKIDKMSY